MIVMEYLKIRNFMFLAYSGHLRKIFIVLMIDVFLGAPTFFKIQAQIILKLFLLLQICYFEIYLL